MKGNTNIKGSPLVIPDVDFCPCCGQWWVATNRNGERFDKKEAKPQLHQVLFDGEAPIQNAKAQRPEGYAASGCSEGTCTH